MSTTRKKAVERLTKRWQEQVIEFPSMRKSIPLAMYISRNVRHVQKNDLLCRYDPDHKPWCRYTYECHTVE